MVILMFIETLGVIVILVRTRLWWFGHVYSEWITIESENKH